MYDSIYPCLRAVSSFISRNGKKKKTLEKSLLLSIMIIIKNPQISHALGNVTFIVPLPLVCKSLVEFYFDHLDTTNAEMPYEKNEHLGAIVFFFSININILYITHEIELHPSSCTVLREMAAVSVVCSAVIFYRVPFNEK